MPFSGEYISGMDWGALQTAKNIIDFDGDSTLDGVSLSNTSGSWSAVDTHSSVRIGAIGYQDHEATVPFVNRNYIYNLSFAVNAVYVVFTAANDLQFRVRDVSNGVTIATVAFPSPPDGGSFFFTYEWQWVTWNDDVDNLPSGDALLELQYSLDGSSTATWFAAVFEQFLWNL